VLLFIYRVERLCTLFSFPSFLVELVKEPSIAPALNPWKIGGVFLLVILKGVVLAPFFPEDNSPLVSGFPRGSLRKDPFSSLQS